MGQMTRAQSLEMWRDISRGIFRQEGYTDSNGDFHPPVGYQLGAYDFIEKVALEIIRAELLAPNIRGDALIKALGLAKTLNDNEHAMRTAWTLTNIFPTYNANGEEITLSSVQKMKLRINIYRRYLGYTTQEPDKETDVARKRQLLNFAKKMGINQDKK